MKKYLFHILFYISLLASFSHVIADSNNGYTTAANIYSGSSSRGWYGGGVAYQLAEWRKKEDVITEVDNTVSVNPETSPVLIDETQEQPVSDISTPAIALPEITITDTPRLDNAVKPEAVIPQHTAN
jgi:hypothetical protein